LGQHFDTQRFVGQGDKEGSDGMTQTEQQETLDRFRNNEFDVLVSTSVAEEGLTTAIPSSPRRESCWPRR